MRCAVSGAKLDREKPHMFHTFIRLLVFFVVLTFSVATSMAQTPPPFAAPPSIPYGPSIDLANAKKAATAAAAEARKNNWTMAIAIVDPGGYGVYFEKMDGTQTGSVDISFDKARSAALFRRPTKVFEDGLAAGGSGWRFLALRGAVPVAGGMPIIVDGKIIGAIGVSGGTNVQDEATAQAGVNAIK
jgi:uncharacterized protein GlcG (DUF336 family)